MDLYILILALQWETTIAISSNISVCFSSHFALLIMSPTPGLPPSPNSRFCCGMDGVEEHQEEREEVESGRHSE